ncbi:tRNA pseudouridine(55) synthase TruB [Salipaludibacillus sp. LMS25]|uniref:tRNA pseudouridine(55) synthase TruB n=1 Tax=Salipaludibacillus sp. LMS25 TaxID=2924031 RepID=UPI0020D11170|nr:tRNA pseudouridine(55) synthase TruB [Salipaludibacillus sp. LMS25]UTR17115.1 tRNA pseudouridine(55) synthase TruB [Salipaludibacillus sp. LMS25]
MTGIFPLWKPKGMTSFTAVKEVGKRFGTKKAGHTGTLDPDVEGVLPICLGKATKLVEYLTADTKTYCGEVMLGVSTTTEDASGEIVAEAYIEDVMTRHDVEDIFEELTGTIEQVPPMYSAVKIKGKKLYEYAREGKTIDRPARQVTIYELKLTSDPLLQEGKVSFTFEVTCSKGTYIRTLCVAMGEKLGYPAHMASLTREASGTFNRKSCYSLEDLADAADKNTQERLLISVEQALTQFPVVKVDEETEKKVLQGAILPLHGEAAVDENLWALYNQREECLALYKKDPKRDGMMKPEKMIRSIHD